MSVDKVDGWLFPMSDEELDVGLLTTDVGAFVGFCFKDETAKEHRIAFPAHLAATVGKTLVMAAVEADKASSEPQKAPESVQGPSPKPPKSWVN